MSTTVTVGTTTVTLTPTSEVAPEVVQADLIVYGAVIAFLTTIWAMKQLYNIFRTGRHES